MLGARHVRGPGGRAGVGGPTSSTAPSTHTRRRSSGSLPKIDDHGPTERPPGDDPGAARRISSHRPRRAASRSVASTQAPTTATRCNPSCARSARGTGCGRQHPALRARRRAGGGPMSTVEQLGERRSETSHNGEPLLVVEHLKKYFPIKKGHPDRPHRRLREGRRRRVFRDLPPARRSASSASRARASRRPATACSSC